MPWNFQIFIHSGQYYLTFWFYELTETYFLTSTLFYHSTVITCYIWGPQSDDNASYYLMVTMFSDTLLLTFPRRILTPSSVWTYLKYYIASHPRQLKFSPSVSIHWTQKGFFYSVFFPLMFFRIISNPPLLGFIFSWFGRLVCPKQFVSSGPSYLNALSVGSPSIPMLYALLPRGGQ